jgi:cell division protein FtsB
LTPPPPPSSASPVAAPRRREPVEPHLRLVRRQRRERARLIGSAALGVIFAILFVLAASQAVLVQGQLELDRLDRELATREEVRDKLAVQVATLESPARLEAVARQLGMVDPPDVVFLDAPASPSVADAAPPVVADPAAMAAAAAAPTP